MICPFFEKQKCSELLNKSFEQTNLLIAQNKKLQAKITNQNIDRVAQTEIDKRKWMQLIFSIILLSTIVVSTVITQRIRFKNIRQKLELKLEALRAQMNPHFISNSINAIESLVNQNKNHEASEYLIDFSRLCRMILDHSKQSEISLSKEIECLKYYLSMESLRLHNQFDYTIHIEQDLAINKIQVPPLIIQPFVENSIWHGIMNKNNPKNGLISIEISHHESDYIRYEITDNGVGRKRAKELKTKVDFETQSWGELLTVSRLNHINTNEKQNLLIEDVINDANQIIGTKVTVIIPLKEM